MSSTSTAFPSLNRITAQLIALLSIFLSNNVQGFAPSCNMRSDKAGVHQRGTMSRKLLPMAPAPAVSGGKFDASQRMNFYTCVYTRRSLRSSISDQQDGDSPVDSPVEDELNRLQNTLHAIEALEERNKAQLESFVDEADQWDSLEEHERELLQSKEVVVQQLEKMTEELLQMWMGAKSMEG